jgi:hypothetical protein
MIHEHLLYVEFLLPEKLNWFSTKLECGSLAIASLLSAKSVKESITIRALNLFVKVYRYLTFLVYEMQLVKSYSCFGNNIQ